MNSDNTRLVSRDKALLAHQLRVAEHVITQIMQIAGAPPEGDHEQRLKQILQLVNSYGGRE